MGISLDLARWGPITKYITQPVPKQEVAQICKLPHKFSFAPVKQSSPWFCLLPVNRCITLCWALVCSWSTHWHLTSWDRNLMNRHLLPLTGGEFTHTSSEKTCRSTVHPSNLDSLERLEKILAVYLTHQPSAISNKCLWDAILGKVLLWVTLERMENGCLNCRENNTVRVVMRMRNNEELSTYSLRDCRQPT